MNNGFYIVFEGIDGTGKTTQINALKKRLEDAGKKVLLVEEPGSGDIKKSTPAANIIARHIKNAKLKRAPEINLVLFSAARRELWFNKIKPALEDNFVVISSRNYYSTLAYQGYGEGLDMKNILKTTKIFTCDRYMNPDFVYVFNLDEKTRKDRLKKRGEDSCIDTFESKKDTFQNKVSKAYSEIAKKYCAIEVDASKSIKEVTDFISSSLKENILK